MLLNYLRIVYRNLLKNKVFSFINIFGLGVGMGAFLLIIQYVRFERSYEDFHHNAANTYRITLDVYNGSEYVITDCETHAPIGPMIKEKIPEVQDFVRMFHSDGLTDIKVGTQKFLEEGIYFADPSAARIFTLETLHGDVEKALTAPFQTVVTASIAKKFFGRTDVIDEPIKIDDHIYTVKSVIADLPENTHLKFGVLLSHATLFKLYSEYKEDNWAGNNEYTYLLMMPGTDLLSFNKKLAALSGTLKDKIHNAKYVAEPIKDIHLYSNKTYEPEVNGNAKVVYFLLIIAIFIIVIAWVNYVNLSTARAVERAREVGIRKVMGSVKAQLIFQFLSESVIINLLAVLVAFVLFQTALPFFRNMIGHYLPLNFMSDLSFWYLLITMFITGSFLSGVYPAFVLSSFQPSAVLKGKFQSSSHGQYLRKGLVVFQFASTVVLIVCVCTVYLQVNHLQNYDLGMNLDQKLEIRAPQLGISDSAYKAIFQSFKTELLRNPNVQKVSRSGSLPGLSLHELSSTIFTRLGQEKATGYEYYYFSIDADFISTMNMSLAAGRNFEDGKMNGDEVIINEEAANRLGFSTPQEALGAKLTFRTRWEAESSTVIGVIKNFYQRSPKEKHIPMLFRYGDDVSYFSVRIDPDHVKETVSSVKATWNELFPNSVMYYFFLDEKYNQQYQSDARFGMVIGTFSVLAVIIACLGLFGLSSFTIVQRTKEIGIRKVLGASVTQIVRLLSQDFVIVVMVAAILAIPISYFAMEEWLSGYAVRIDLKAWMFVLPVIIILVIALATVSFQTIKTALANPTNSLRQE